MIYRLECQETEIWDRVYLVEAKTKKEAKAKLLKGEFEECPYGETEYTKIKIKSCEED